MKKLYTVFAIILAASVLCVSCGPPKDAKGIKKKKSPMGWM